MYVKVLQNYLMILLRPKVFVVDIFVFLLYISFCAFVNTVRCFLVLLQSRLPLFLMTLDNGKICSFKRSSAIFLFVLRIKYTAEESFLQNRLTIFESMFLVIPQLFFGAVWYTLFLSYWFAITFRQSYTQDRSQALVNEYFGEYSLSFSRTFESKVELTFNSVASRSFRFTLRLSCDDSPVVL